MAQLALAWCLHDPGISSVIIGATRVEQLAENSEAPEFEVPSDAASAIDGLFLPGRKFLRPDEGNL